MSPMPLGIVASSGGAGPIPTLVESSGIGTIINADDVPIVFTFTTSLQQGDIVLLAGADDVGKFLGETPAGYTLGFSGSTNSTGHFFAYKVMGAVPDTSVSITGSSENTRAMGYMVWRGIDPVNPIALISSTTTGQSGMPNPPAINTNGENNLVLALGFLDDDRFAAFVTSPTGFTMTVTSQSLRAGSTLMVAHTLSTSGEQLIDPGAFGPGNSLASDAWVAATVEFNSLLIPA